MRLDHGNISKRMSRTQDHLRDGSGGRVEVNSMVFSLDT